ncbi:XrtV sorting system accessory protein [Novosphingopyxis baekryungensis]|uniref:XrtV sorting system accessory protein n=1 Tax=Novosphingopyxis baekryungensis TaxID=279369 RepID=UPI0003B47109|nr:XrtV sorting system accessory protein [Novosphingopyxis baekryungensis]
METFWDWITVFAFAGLLTLLMQRSSEDEPRDKLWQYIPPAVGCAVANYVGNEGYDIVAAIILGSVIGYIFIVLKVKLPFLRQ